MASNHVIAYLHIILSCIQHLSNGARSCTCFLNIFLFLDFRKQVVLVEDCVTCVNTMLDHTKITNEESLFI